VRTLLVLALLAACDSGALPLDVEVRDRATAPGGKLGEIEIVAKTLPSTEVVCEGQTKDTGAQAEVSFIVSKSTLKLGQNRFAVGASNGGSMSKRSKTVTATWDATPKTLLRFWAPAVSEAEGELTCASVMCASSAVKIAKGAKLPLEIESGLAANATVQGQAAALTPAGRAKVEVDLAGVLAGLPVGKEEAPLTIGLESGGATAKDVLPLSGPALTALAARMLAEVERGPVLFGAEAPSNKKPDALVVVGVPGAKIVAAGRSVTYADIDLVGVAKPVERFFGCGPGGSGILYYDLQVKVYERRSGKPAGEKKLLADRVTCPPTAQGGVLKAYVREDDVKRVLSELLVK
jgi:hypothetical protein